MGTAAAGSWRDDASTGIDDWMAKRWADLERLGSDADAAGREALGWAARTGADIFAPRSHDVALAGDQYRSAQAGADAAGGITPPAPPQEIEKVEPGAGPDDSTPEPMDLGMRFQAARPGDSITRMIGSSDPKAVGKFLSLNGMGGGESTIRARRSYIVPTRWDDATDGEARAGQALLGADDARLQAAAESEARLALSTVAREPFPDFSNGRTSGGMPSSGAAGDGSGSWLDRSPTAKLVGGTLAYTAGLAPGLVRSGYNTIRGGVDAGLFVSRLMDPYDWVRSAPGQSADEQVMRFASQSVRKVKHAIADPKSIESYIANQFHDFRQKEDPTVIPMGATMGDQLNTAFTLGVNNGELIGDLVSLVGGGEFLKGAAGLGAISKVADAKELEFLAKNPELAEYFSQSYKGMSHHVIGRNQKLPKFLGGGLYPREFIESPFNKIRSNNMTVRDFYRNHVGVDNHYYGGRAPKAAGGGWSANDLGWDRYRGFDRFSYGTAPATKGVLGSAVVGGVAGGQFTGGVSQ